MVKKEKAGANECTRPFRGLLQLLGTAIRAAKQPAQERLLLGIAAEVGSVRYIAGITLPGVEQLAGTFGRTKSVFEAIA